MGKVLILCSRYGKYKDANGVCVDNIAQEFVRRGYAVKIISEAFKDDHYFYEKGIEVFSVKTSWFTAFVEKHSKDKKMIDKMVFKIISFFRKAFAAVIYPNVSPVRSYKVLEKAKQIIEENDIDLVLATYRPFESLFVASRLKSYYGKSITVVTYHLDLMMEPNDTNTMIRAWKHFKGKKHLGRELKLCDRVLLPESDDLRREYDLSNVDFVDFPLYKQIVPEENVKTEIFSSEEINISYVGTLDKKNRNPKTIIDILENMGNIKNKPIKLHIWGKLSDVETEEIVTNSKVVAYHGSVASEEIPILLSSTDFLLNVSNKTTYKMIPSKIFQLFAANKPIINLVRHKEDVSLKYFNKVGPVFYIYEFEKSDVKNDLSRFIESMYQKPIFIDQTLFKNGTPEYVVDKIILQSK